jgi:transposase InsO family protein
VKYAVIESYQTQFRVTMMCRLLEVSRSGFYRWLSRAPSVLAQRRALVTSAAVRVYHQFKKRYGSRRIAVELNENNIPCSVNHVAKLLKEQDLKARNGKRFKYAPSVEASTNVADNLLNRQFKVEAPNLKWVSDITYIKVGKEWLYLAVVMDLYSRKVVGWALDNHMREALIIEAFEMAVSLRKLERNALIHSDRGVQYRGNRYQQILLDNMIQCSMSRKGNCWDNAAMESFFGRLKVELIYAENYKTMDEARAGIFEYIELFYNPVRRHSALGYKSPIEFEEKPNG